MDGEKVAVAAFVAKWRSDEVIFSARSQIVFLTTSSCLSIFTDFSLISASFPQARLLKPLMRYWLFLCVGSSVALMAPSLAAKARPAAVPFLPAGYDFPVTCVTFAAATLLLQDKFARVLERRPPAPAPRLTLNPLVAWPLAVCTWLFATGCFVRYLSFGVDSYYFERRWSEWAAAGAASAANLAMATRTVTRYFRSSRAFGSANDAFAALA